MPSLQRREGKGGVLKGNKLTQSRQRDEKTGTRSFEKESLKPYAQGKNRDNEQFTDGKVDFRTQGQKRKKAHWDQKGGDRVGIR